LPLLKFQPSYIQHARYFSFADDVTVYRTVSSALLAPDSDVISAAKCMALNTGNTRVIAFTREMKAINYSYKRCDNRKTRSDSVEDLTLNYKLLFHHQVHCTFSQSL